MAAGDTEYKFRNDKGVLAKLETMLNNEERSDTLFLVNDARYRVLSHLVAVYSPVLESMINEHFAYCDDRDIKIRNVKNEESFHLMLKFMYGVEMNFTQTNIIVICESLSLAEKYEIGDFSKELKSYITSTPARFQIDTVVILLNTARKLNMTDLYEKAKVYAYENTEQLVKHDSFVDLQYEVLVDLLKSDYFCAKEIEILNGLLTWHDDMDSKKSKDKEDETTLHDTDSGFEQVGNNVCHSVASETDLVDYYDTKSEYKETTSSINDTSGLENISELPRETSCSNNTDNANLSRKPDSCAELVKSFKENVLKSLLSHIRIGHVSALVLMIAFETELFTKYKDYFADYKLFSQSTEPRKEYVSTASTSDVTSFPRSDASISANDTVNPANDRTNAAVLHNKFYNLKRIFTFKRYSVNTLLESEEEYCIGCLKYKMDLKEYFDFDSDIAYFQLGMICTSDEQNEWKSMTTIVPTWHPRAGSKKTKRTFCTCVYFNKKVSRHIILSQVSFDLKDLETYNDFVLDNTIQIEIDFSSIHFKTL